MSTDSVSPPRRLRATRRGGSKWPAGIYVGRPRKFGNPWIVGRDGTAEEVVERYRTAILTDGLPHPNHPERPRITVEVVRAELAGHDLLCWCPPDRPCHADVLLQIANES